MESVNTGPHWRSAAGSRSGGQRAAGRGGRGAQRGLAESAPAHPPSAVCLSAATGGLPCSSSSARGALTRGVERAGARGGVPHKVGQIGVGLPAGSDERLQTATRHVRGCCGKNGAVGSARSGLACPPAAANVCSAWLHWRKAICARRRRQLNARVAPCGHWRHRPATPEAACPLLIHPALPFSHPPAPRRPPAARFPAAARCRCLWPAPPAPGSACTHAVHGRAGGAGCQPSHRARQRSGLAAGPPRSQGTAAAAAAAGCSPASRTRCSRHQAQPARAGASDSLVVQAWPALGNRHRVGGAQDRLHCGGSVCGAGRCHGLISGALGLKRAPGAALRTAACSRAHRARRPARAAAASPAQRSAPRPPRPPTVGHSRKVTAGVRLHKERRVGGAAGRQGEEGQPSGATGRARCGCRKQSRVDGPPQQVCPVGPAISRPARASTH